MDKRKSFTIIELLVVVGIIIILVSVLLVALGPARKKAKDTRIISALTQIQNRAEQLYLDNGKYPGACCETGCDPEIISLCDDINAQGGSAFSALDSRQRTYCVYANLSTEFAGQTEVFCVDSIGFANKLILPACSVVPYTCYPCYDFDESGVVDSGDIAYVGVCAYPTPGWVCASPKPAGCDPKDWGCERLDIDNNARVSNADVYIMDLVALLFPGRACQILK